MTALKCLTATIADTKLSKSTKSISHEYELPHMLTEHLTKQCTVATVGGGNLHNHCPIPSNMSDLCRARLTARSSSALTPRVARNVAK
eukprot:1828646-Pleurochrysis_carterae.AAC.1